MVLLQTPCCYHIYPDYHDFGVIFYTRYLNPQCRNIKKKQSLRVLRTAVTESLYTQRVDVISAAANYV